MAKFLEVPPRLLGRSAFTRLMKAVPNLDAVHVRLIDQLDLDYAWPRADEWMGLFGSGFFKQETSKSFWIQFVKEARVLNAERLTASSRHRLMRNWVQRRKGRVQFELFLSLASAVTEEQAVLAGLSTKGREHDAWFQTSILRIAEALSRIRPLPQCSAVIHCKNDRNFREPAPAKRMAPIT
jgi:hypothetical protein